MAQEKHPIEKFREFIDAVKMAAFQRGVKEPEWVDVWTTMCGMPEYSGVLRNKGIDTGALASDLHFITRFGTRNDGEFAFGRTTGELFEQVRQEVLIELMAALESFEELYPQEALQALVRGMADGAKETMKQMLRPGNEIDEARVKIKLSVMDTVLQAIARNLQKEQLLPPDIQGDLIELLKATTRRMMTPQLKFGNNEPIAMLELMGNVQQVLPPTPLETVEKIMALTAHDFNDLWIRNGLLTDEAPETDPWKDALPGDRTVALFSEALARAYTYHSKNLEPRHIALQLLSSRDVQVHLNKLGVKNQQELREKFEEKLFKAEIESESKAQSHVNVEGVHSLIWDLNEILKGGEDDDSKAPRALRLLMARYPAIDAAMNEAGLRRRMLRGWNKAYDLDEKDKKGKPDDGKKKKKKEFEVSDDELNALIKEYCVDYTKLAGEKKFDPMIGNEGTMEEIITILLKRGRKNPMAVGEPGVGKTKLLEGLAQRMVKGDVPQKLIGGRLLYFDPKSMDNQPFVGIFEDRLMTIAKGIAERNAAGRPPILLGMDEFGSGMDAGGGGSRAGTSELLKPYLTSGDLFVFANMTRDEWQRKGKKNGALARRFNEVSLVPPDDKQTANILLKLKPKYARHHGLRVPDQLMGEIARMAGRYVPGNQPDKSIDALDTACAIAARAGVRTLDEDHVIAAISSKSGIDRDFLGRGDTARYRSLETDLNREVLGQKAAAKAVAGALKRAKAGLKNPKAPVGNFLFLGPTGVGKTETVRALARLLFGGEDRINKFDMSEYQEKHAVARFIGAPAGYVGFDEGGGLINKLQANPRAVNLYDEVEKAHEDVFNVLLAPFEEGIVTDGRGFEGNMRECLNILTGNLGAREVQAEGERLGLDPLKDREAWNRMAAPIYERAARRFFRPEFLNRLDGIIVYETLDAPVIEALVDRRIGETQTRLREKYPALSLELSPAFRDALKVKGIDPLYGARPLSRVVKNDLETPMADFLLDGKNTKALRRGKVMFVEAVQRAFDVEEIVRNAQPGEDLRELIREANVFDLSFSLR